MVTVEVFDNYRVVNCSRCVQGRRARGTGGRPPNLRWGDGPRIRPPNILRSSVVGCAQKYEQSKKGCFSCEERVIYDIEHTENLGKERENRKNLVHDLKKGYQKFLA